MFSGQNLTNWASNNRFSYHIFWNVIFATIRSSCNLVKNEIARPLSLRLAKFIVSDPRRISGHREATNNKLVNNIPGGKICTLRSNAKSGMQPFWYTARDTPYSDIIHLNRLMCQTDYRSDSPSLSRSPSRLPRSWEDHRKSISEQKFWTPEQILEEPPWW